MVKAFLIANKIAINKTGKKISHKVVPLFLFNTRIFFLINAFNFEESHIVGLCNYNDTDFCASTMGGKLWYFKWNEKNNNHDRIGPINAHQKEIYGITQLKKKLKKLKH